MKKAEQIGWMWYPGDLEIYHGMLQNFSREERGYNWPAYWHTDGWNHRVVFERTLELEEETVFTVHARGIGNVTLREGGKDRDINVNEVKYPLEQEVKAGPGTVTVSVLMGNIQGLPCIYVEGEKIHSDPYWTASNMLETAPAGFSPLFADLSSDPETVPYRKRVISPASFENRQSLQGNYGVLVTFAQVVNGYVNLEFTGTEGSPLVCYGESEKEALDEEWCYYFERNVSDGTIGTRRAFRFLFIKNVTADQVQVSAVHTYIDIPVKASFHSDDELLNRIFDTAVETFRQCSGMFFIDGIKRDRWVWSGDAYQSYVVNPYIFFDPEINKRTLLALRGNLGIQQHLNTIVDYSLLWIMGVWHQYQMTADLAFVRDIYDKAADLMDLCRKQTNDLGFIYGRKQDWIFIDWADIDKTGTTAAEQVLLVQAYDVMARLSDLLEKDGSVYREAKTRLYENLLKYFWSEEKGAFIDSYESGKNHVSRHANLFAVFFDLVDEEKQRKILDNVILNDEIPAITTPYFKFFELDVLAKTGHLEEVMKRMKEYWGGMLERGAVTFWEEYKPAQNEAEQYGMYSDPYGKSLCHAWGASPVYLLGKYFLGVRPASPGYKTWTADPVPGFFKELDACVPLPEGRVHIVLKNGEFTSEYVPDTEE